MSFFHGVTVTLVDTGARHIATPSASIIGLCNTFTVGPPATAAANELLLITRESEAVAAWGPDAAITQDCKAIFKRSKAVIVAVGVPLLDDPAEQLSAIIGGVWADGSRTGMQALLNGKSKFNAQPRLLVTPGYSSTLAVGTELVALGDKMRAMAILDGPNTTDEAAIDYAGNFGSKHAYMVGRAVLGHRNQCHGQRAGVGLDRRPVCLDRCHLRFLGFAIEQRVRRHHRHHAADRVSRWRSVLSGQRAEQREHHHDHP
jgi:phage tail sheath protein FI